MKRLYEIEMLAISYCSYGLAYDYYNYCCNIDILLLLALTAIGAYVYDHYRLFKI
jgi:hypothetical protein